MTTLMLYQGRHYRKIYTVGKGGLLRIEQIGPRSFRLTYANDIEVVHGTQYFRYFK